MQVTGERSGQGGAEPQTQSGKDTFHPLAKDVAEGGDREEGQDPGAQGLEAPWAQILQRLPTSCRTQPGMFLLASGVLPPGSRADRVSRIPGQHCWPGLARHTPVFPFAGSSSGLPHCP